MRLTRMVTSRRWRRVPRVTAGTAAVALLAGLACGAVTGSSPPAARPHTGMAARHALEAAAVKYHGVIGGPPPALETAAKAPAPPPLDMAGYDACANPQAYAPHSPQNVWNQAAAYVAGWSDASKLGESAVVGSPTAALADANSGNQPNAGEGYAAATPIASNNFQYFCGMTRLQLDYHGQREFPPLRATFLANGFVPVTATVHLTQAGSAPVTTVAFNITAAPSGQFAPIPAPVTVVSTADVSLRLSDVAVNGVPLDVGGDCHTTGRLTSPNPVNPSALVMTGGTQPGDPPPFFGVNGDGVLGGGSLAGDATIPPFTGCVGPGGDNLDPLLDATVSGPGNYVHLVVGQVCFNDGTNAPGPNQVPACSASPGVPASKPFWTVTHGTGSGGFTASSGQMTLQTREQSLIASNGYRIGCTGSSIRATIPDASGPPRDGALGSVTWTGFSGCAGYRFTCPPRTPGGPPPIACPAAGQLPAADGSTWTITQEGTAYLDGTEYDPGSNPPATGAVTALNTDDVVFDLTGTGVPVTPGSATRISCTAQLTETIASGQYSNSGSVLTIGSPSLESLLVAKSTCPAGAKTGLSLLNGQPGTGFGSEGNGAIGGQFVATYHLAGTVITSP